MKINMDFNNSIYQEEVGADGGAGGMPAEDIAYQSPPKSVTDIKQIPDLLKNQYRFDDAKKLWHFIPVEGLKTALEKERAEAERANKKFETINSILKKHNLISDEDGGLSPEIIESRLTSINERLSKTSTDPTVNRNNEKEIIDKALTEAKKEWKAQMDVKDKAIKELSEKSADYKQRLENTILQHSIQSAVSSVSLSDSGKRLLPLLLKEHTRLVEEDGRYVVRVLDHDSSNSDTPYRINKGGDSMTVEEYIQGPLRDEYADLFYITSNTPSSGVLNSTTKSSTGGNRYTQSGGGTANRLSNVKDGVWTVSQDELFELIQRHNRGEQNAYSEAMRLGLHINS